jgi:hypothetical protein
MLPAAYIATFFSLREEFFAVERAGQKRLTGGRLFR